MRNSRSVPPALLLLAFGSLPVAAQKGTGYVALPEAREIALARSAAPAAVSAEATIWVLRNGKFEVAVKGTNGNTCIVSRTWPTSVEPICYDPEGTRTILPIEIRLVESRIRTGDGDAALAAIMTDIERGAIPLPKRPSMSYMLSSAQILVDDDGTEVGPWKPHFMMYIPYMTSKEMGLFGETSQVFVAHDGEPLAHVITVAPAFIDPAPAR